ncbi:MAG: hypothetical protein QOH81_3504 [Sphingomonadales bacterium]|nr:hypothetical protein [Sphingomonadales bacterium]
MAEIYTGMTVNERLSVGGLLDAYDAAVATKDLGAINAVLRQVGLRQDESGMNWTIGDNAKD